MIETLASEKNPLLKQVRRAAMRGELTDDGYAIAEGFHLLDEALESRVEIGAIVASDSASAALTARAARLEAYRVAMVPAKIFAGLTTTQQPQGVIALVRPKTWLLEDVFHGRVLAVVLDGVQDPGNAGAIIRAAEAFGATGAVFLQGAVNPYNPKSLRGSAGSVFRLPVVTGVSDEALFAAAKNVQATLYSAAPHVDRVLSGANLADPCAVVIGAEGRGIRDELGKHTTQFRIPMKGVESLNAAVACGVVLYEAQRQRSRG